MNSKIAVVLALFIVVWSGCGQRADALSMPQRDLEKQAIALKPPVDRNMSVDLSSKTSAGQHVGPQIPKETLRKWEKLIVRTIRNVADSSFQNASHFLRSLKPNLVRTFVRQHAAESDNKMPGLFGLHENGVTTFPGVRYGRVVRRFDRPLPIPDTWQTETSAIYGNAHDGQDDERPGMHWYEGDNQYIPQQGPPCYMSMPGGMFGQGTEDCLTMNVHTPWAPLNTSLGPNSEVESNAEGLLPVLVLLTGGQFLGSEDHRKYHLGYGETLAKAQQAIVVGVQYRVGALGFMAHKDQNPEQYNAGILDQHLALQWVHNNIHSFGGDKNHVILVGHSAGAVSACALHVAPSEYDTGTLFQSVALLSGGCDSGLFHWDQTEALKKNAEYISAVWKHVCGCPRCYNHLPQGCECSTSHDDGSALTCLQDLRIPSDCVHLHEVGTSVGIAQSVANRIYRGWSNWLAKEEEPADEKKQLRLPPRGPWGPVIAPGSIIPTLPIEAIAEGAGADRLMITGYMENDFLPLNSNGEYWLNKVVMPMLGDMFQGGPTNPLPSITSIDWATSFERLYFFIFMYDDARWSEEYARARKRLMSLISIRYFEHTHVNLWDVESNKPVFKSPSYATPADTISKAFRDWIFVCPAFPLKRTRRELKGAPHGGDRTFMFAGNFCDQENILCRWLGANHFTILMEMFNQPLGASSYPFNLNQMAKGKNSKQVVQLIQNAMKRAAMGEAEISNTSVWLDEAILQIGTPVENMFNNRRIINNLPVDLKAELLSDLAKQSNNASTHMSNIDHQWQLHHCDLWDRLELLQEVAFAPPSKLYASRLQALAQNPLNKESWPSQDPEIGPTIRQHGFDVQRWANDTMLGRLTSLKLLLADDNTNPAVIHVQEGQAHDFPSTSLPTGYDEFGEMVDGVNGYFKKLASLDAKKLEAELSRR